MVKKNKKKKSNIKFRRFIGRTLAVIIVIGVVLIISTVIYGINIGINYVQAKIIPQSIITSVLDVIDDELATPEIVVAERVEMEIEPTTMPVPATETDITDASITAYENAVIVGDSGYYYYDFDLDTAEYFTLALNTSIANIDNDVNIYTMIIPSAIDIMLPIDFLYDYADYTSDQEKAIDYFSFYTDSRATTIDIYDIFKAHCDEKLYFNSDTNWTSLAAFYAYEEFMYYTGETSNSISDYIAMSTSGFLGNIYTYYNLSAISSYETIDYYVPSSSLTITNSDNEIFADVSSLSESNKYNLFLGGSRDMTQIENSSVTDGSVIVVVGDAYGYSLVPYLADEYQYTYFIDYRYYTDDLSDFVDSVGADDLLYLFGISTTVSSTAISNID